MGTRCNGFQVFIFKVSVQQISVMEISLVCHSGFFVAFLFWNYRHCIEYV